MNENVERKSQSREGSAESFFLLSGLKIICVF
jgi:hypothetical protein